MMVPVTGADRNPPVVGYLMLNFISVGRSAHSNPVKPSLEVLSGGIRDMKLLWISCP